MLFAPVLVIPALVATQPATPSATTAPLRLFLDCQNTSCDQEFLRTQLTWVDWVRDRKSAQVHMILTSLRNGGGGTQYVLRFLGLETFVGLDDEVRFDAPPAATQDDVRKELAARIALALGRYTARMPAPDRLRVQPAEGAARAANTQVQGDPWNSWVHKLSANSYFSGESQYASSNISTSWISTRITEDDILRFRASGYWNKNRYELSDGTLRSSSESYYASAVKASALSEHWTWGVMASWSRAETENMARSLRLAPGIEYNLWKYSEATRRQLTFLYQVALVDQRYFEETIYGRTRETQVANALNISLDLSQPWGSVTVSANASAYVKDWSKNSLGVFGSLNLRLVKGLSLSVFANYSKVRDQLALARSGATDQEVLLRLKELGTSYRYFTGLGLSYTFGSIFNNAVNTRFRSETGGRSFSFSY